MRCRGIGSQRGLRNLHRFSQMETRIIRLHLCCALPWPKHHQGSDPHSEELEGSPGNICHWLGLHGVNWVQPNKWPVFYSPKTNVPYGFALPTTSALAVCNACVDRPFNSSKEVTFARWYTSCNVLLCILAGILMVKGLWTMARWNNGR